MFGNITQRKGNDYIKIHKQDTSIKVGKSYLYLEDVFPNNPAITETINQNINENADVLFVDLEPLISKAVGELILLYTNRIYDLFSMDQLFPI